MNSIWCLWVNAAVIFVYLVIAVGITVLRLSEKQFFCSIKTNTLSTIFSCRVRICPNKDHPTKGAV